MKYLRITNQGEIDPHALTLWGASVKDEDAVGEFGSGWKYSIAAILRHNLDLHIFSGEKEIKISTSPAEFRGEKFDVIHINDQPTSITTRSGPKWRVIDAAREIYSNALDEGIATWSYEERISGGKAGQTSIYIELSSELREMFDNLSSYFLTTQKPLHTNSKGSILSLPTNNIFRRGVWISEDSRPPLLFSYNFNNYNLPESRLVSKNSAYYDITRFLNEGITKEIADRLVGAVLNEFLKDYLEVRAVGSWLTSAIHPDLRAAFHRQYKSFVSESYRGRRPEGSIVVNPNVFDVLSQWKCTCGHEPTSGFTPIQPLPGMREKVVAAQALLKRKLNIDYSPYPVEFVKFEENLLAQAKDGKCLLSLEIFNEDDPKLLEALIEEWTHLHHSVEDGSVGQQHVYLSLITKLLQ